MAYKSILTVLTRAEDAALAIGSAARLAMAQDAHLDVLVLGRWAIHTSGRVRC